MFSQLLANLLRGTILESKVLQKLEYEIKNVNNKNRLMLLNKNNS